MAAYERRRSDDKDFHERVSYEARLALRRVQSSLLALDIITAVGVLGYTVLERWGLPTPFT